MRRASSGTIVPKFMPVLLVGAALATAGCPDENGDEIVDPTTLNSVSVSGSNTVTVGQTLQLTATANFSNNTTQNVTTTATWESGSTGIATVNNAGLVTGVAAGSAEIRARFQNVTGALGVTVNAIADPNPVARFTVSGPGGVDVCRVVAGTSGDIDCNFDGTASTGGAGSTVAQWTWRFDVGPNSGGPFTVTNPVFNPNPGCAYFNVKPSPTGSGFTQMVVKLIVRNAAGSARPEVINNNVRLFPQNQCGFGF